MSTEIRVPKLGMSMTEGVLVEWLVADGASVEIGTPIYSLETDKSVQEIESSAAGTLKIVGEVGETYEPGALIGSID
ncbi:biotin/lipoyl-containing protein [Sphingomonas sp. 37zxx]|uniref:biotin/lipoyl-containing protein n=1 Tax=Sphingomonas sp. 37zxx TaxID=1550073 RepID=UPI00053C061C|nr:lipoyl domain-containing protein [Sphingomonas sp. 37zxx]